jgi:NarL family two-component system response regulator LiaR
MRIVIHDSNSLLSNLLSTLLQERGFSVKITDGSPESLQNNFTSFRPDVVILGKSSHPQGALRSYLNIQENAQATFAKTSYILLFKDEEPLTIQNALKMGIGGLIHEDDGLASIILGIQEIGNGRQYVSPLLVGVLNYIRINLLSVLTSTEQQIMQLILQGNNTRKIAQLLFRSEETIKSHRKSIKSKIGIRGGKNCFISHISSILMPLGRR